MPAVTQTRPISWWGSAAGQAWNNRLASWNEAFAQRWVRIASTVVSASSSSHRSETI